MDKQNLCCGHCSHFQKLSKEMGDCNVLGIRVLCNDNMAIGCNKFSKLAAN